MRKRYPAHANFLDDEMQVVPVWAWLLVVVVISLVLVVR